MGTNYLKDGNISELLEKIYSANKVIIDYSEDYFNSGAFTLAASINQVTCDDLYVKYKQTGSNEFLKLIFNNISRLLNYVLRTNLNLYEIMYINDDERLEEPIRKICLETVLKLVDNQTINASAKDKFLDFLVGVKKTTALNTISELEIMDRIELVDLSDKLVNFYVENNILLSIDNLYILLYKINELEDSNYDKEITEDELFMLLTHYYTIVQELAYQIVNYNSNEKRVEKSLKK